MSYCMATLMRDVVVDADLSQHAHLVVGHGQAAGSPARWRSDGTPSSASLSGPGNARLAPSGTTTSSGRSKSDLARSAGEGRDLKDRVDPAAGGLPEGDQLANRGAGAGGVPVKRDGLGVARSEGRARFRRSVHVARLEVPMTTALSRTAVLEGLVQDHRASRGVGHVRGLGVAVDDQVLTSEAGDGNLQRTRIAGRVRLGDAQVFVLTRRTRTS